MSIRLNNHFDGKTLERARQYASQGLVVSVDVLVDGSLSSKVGNGRGQNYVQQITVGRDRIDGVCSCPVGYNCKHIAAVLMSRGDEQEERVAPLASPLRGWLSSVQRNVPKTQAREELSEDYPDSVKDRLLYVLMPGPQVRVSLFKGRINAARTGLNKSIWRYDAAHALRGSSTAQFIRPVDLDLLGALAQTRLWDVGYVYGLPDLLRPKGADVIALIRRLCETGRFLHDNAPDATLNWSDHRPAPCLAWRMSPDGSQRLGFEDEAGQALAVRSLDGAALWLDTQAGRIGALEGMVDPDVLQLVQTCPEVAPHEVDALGAALPVSLSGLDLPRPRAVRHDRRAASHRKACLLLSRETARDGPRYFGDTVELPALALRFVYDGQEVRAEDGGIDPTVLVDGVLVTLARDHQWEADCAARLMEAGAMPLDELEVHWPSERLLEYDFVFVDGEINARTFEVSDARAALNFAFRMVPTLRREGWEVTETSKWPFRISDEEALLSVATQSERGDAFQGNDWFSLGFKAEIGGKSVDVAPLIAAFLEQIGTGWDDVPDVEALSGYLADHPVYLDRGVRGYVALDLSPLAPLLQLFLAHHAEMGALHPSDAHVARLAEEALAGSSVRFSDKAGILPLARSLQALAEADGFQPPRGLKVQLRDYQSFGAAWMGSVLAAGFGAVLADDMGLGKTVQTLALLQARVEAGAPGPVLLIVPTSLLYSWQAQAAQFAPDLRLAVLHGPDRAAFRDAALKVDLVLTTYPLLARDGEWLAAQDWPLVIIDEAQTLKNPAAQMAKTLREIPARGRLALTGTPLENSLQDIWTLIDWVNPGLLGDRKRFQTLFRTPIEKQGDPAAQARLNRRLRPFLLRRTKEEVAAELPPKTEIIERVDLSKPQQTLYETVRSVMDARVREAISIKGMAAARITVLDALLKLRQVCCDPALIKSEAARSVTDSAKRARLRALLGELVAEGRRVLVFSQFVEMLRLIEDDLNGMGIASLSLTGQSKDRAGVLDAFARGDAPVFLLSLKAGGVGLTLTEADTVILYDPWWNPAAERQAMDRTHRIGQDKPVFVHRLVAAGTVEEKILDMQSRKQALADALFTDTGGTGATSALLDEATLQDLFAPMTR